MGLGVRNTQEEQQDWKLEYVKVSVGKKKKNNKLCKIIFKRNKLELFGMYLHITVLSFSPIMLDCLEEDTVGLTLRKLSWMEDQGIYGILEPETFLLERWTLASIWQEAIDIKRRPAVWERDPELRYWRSWWDKEGFWSVRTERGGQ